MYIAKIKRVNPEKLAQLTFLDKSQFFLYPLYKKRLRACWVLLAVVNLIEVNSPYTTGNRKSFPNFRLHKKLFLAYYLLQVCTYLPNQKKFKSNIGVCTKMVSIVDYKKKNYIIYLVHWIRNPIKNIQCSRYVYGISVESNIRNFKIERLNLK